MQKKSTNFFAAHSKRTDHPLALLFWTQIFFVYAMPVGLEIIYRLRHGVVAPGHMLRALLAIYPFAMLGAATVTALSDIAFIYVYLIRTARRLPSAASGAIYALFVFIAYALIQSGQSNAAIAWGDYIEAGSTTGIIVLLLALVVEMFGAVFIVCQVLALGRRWRRLGRMASPPASHLDSGPKLT